MVSHCRQAQDGGDLRDVPVARRARHLHGPLAQPLGGLRRQGEQLGQGVPDIIPRHRRSVEHQMIPIFCSLLFRVQGMPKLLYRFARMLQAFSVRGNCNLAKPCSTSRSISCLFVTYWHHFVANIFSHFTFQAQY